MRRDALLRLADIAADRAGVPWVPPQRFALIGAPADASPGAWRRVAAGVAQGDAVALLALGRGLLTGTRRDQFADPTDAGLTALRLAHLLGGYEVRMVAAVELLLALPNLAADETASRTRRGRTLAIAHMIHDSLERSGRLGSATTSGLLAEVVIAWIRVAELIAERRLLDLATGHDRLSSVQAGLRTALAARAARTDGDDLLASDKGHARPGHRRGSMLAEDGPPFPEDDDDAIDVDAGAVTNAGDAERTLVPHPGYDPLRLGEGRTGRGSQYAVLGTPLPLVAAPGRVEAEQVLGDLAAEMPNFAGVLDRVADQLTLLRRLRGRPSLRLAPLLLLGPPGIGKTRLCRRLADSLGLPYAWLSLAGSSDSRELAGTARGWSNSHPGWALEQVAQLRCANPLLLLDEVDKAGGSSGNGRAHDTILPLLEPSTAACHVDECLGGPVDLSRISWILTANSVAGLPGPLRSRLDVVAAAPPSLHQVGAVMRTMLGDLAAEHGVADARLLPAIPAEVLAVLRAGYARHPDPRRLRRGLAQALAGAARHEEQDAGAMAKLH